MAIVTWDSANKGAGVVLSNGNLTAVVPGATNTVRASLGRSSGKWYWEITINALTASSGAMVGIVNGLASLTATNFSTQNVRYFYSHNGAKYPDVANYGKPFYANDVIGIALDLDVGTLTFYQNGVSYGFSHTNIKNMGEVFPAITTGSNSSASTNTANFGATAFTYDIPEGYRSYDDTQSSVYKILLSSNGNIYSPTLAIIENVTNMTSNTSPAPFVAKTSASEYSPAFNAFNSSTAYWRGNSNSGWIAIDYGAKKKVNRVKLTCGRTVGPAISYAPKDFTIDGSNDGINWLTLARVKDETGWALGESRYFWLDGDFNFSQYRVNIIENNGSATTIALEEILFIYHEVKYISVPSATEVYFLSHGISPSTFNTIFQARKIHDFSGKLDILYYTGGFAKKLEKTLNYSPIDELNGQIEMVTYLDKSNESRRLEYKGVPTGQFTNLINTTLADDINSIAPTEPIEPQVGSIKYVLSPDNITWYSYKNGNWIVVDTSNKMNILSDGMSRSELVLLQRNQLQQIIVDRFSIGILLTESFRTVEEIGVDKIDFGVSIRANNAQVNKADFSILNTTAEINVTFAGNTLSGNVNDIDKGKVQYSISLNGAPYYPSDGSFTILQPSPVNLRITLDPKLILIGQTNTIQVLFRDAWGNTDVWDTTFIGTMTGLLFADASGNYYSTENGTVLQQLDFGTIIAGQTTLEHEIKLKNTYGYTVKNIRISANQQNFPTGAKLQFGTNLTSFEALDELVLNRQMNDGDDLTFYVRMQTQIGTAPIPSNAFDIEVAADKA